MSAQTPSDFHLEGPSAYLTTARSLGPSLGQFLVLALSRARLVSGKVRVPTVRSKKILTRW